ncbi:uncharacterized protein LOC142590288 isoform X2 [Dermacentor variabilis]|uniref:uncharacterized protein LOC142590288 isoform X2 n=1 Tax=Dermacentor variabilis TaxID=34621 RepID=UPI003F5B7DBE
MSVLATLVIATTLTYPFAVWARDGAPTNEGGISSAGTTTRSEETTAGTTVPANNVTTMAPETTRLASDDGCIEGSIPNVMNIGQCLGDDLDLCSGKKTAAQAYLSLVRCTARGTFKNMSPLNSFIALRDIFTVVINRFNPNLASWVRNINFKPDGSDLSDNICREPIKLGFPNSLGKCLGNTYKLCEDGEMVDVPFTMSFAAAVAVNRPGLYLAIFMKIAIRRSKNILAINRCAHFHACAITPFRSHIKKSH